jgi:hypothetical protein
LSLDIDECQVNATVCDGLCQNYEGYYTCYCDTGYQLASDNYTCIGTVLQNV